MKKQLLLLFLLTTLFAAAGCEFNKKPKTVDENPREQVVVEEVYEDDEDDYVTTLPDEPTFTYIDNTIGFVTIDEQYPDSTLGKIEMLYPDGTEWISFYSNYYDKEDWPDDFSPWAFHLDYTTFVMRCVAENDDSYTVIVNDETKEERIIKKHPKVKFATLETHILTGVIIGLLYPELNPIKESPDENAENIDLNGDYESFVAIDIQGDWVQLEDIYTTETVGWVKWRDDDRFMIGIYYFM